jgi:hypothetical protein
MREYTNIKIEQKADEIYGRQGEKHIILTAQQAASLLAELLRAREEDGVHNHDVEINFTL